MKKYAIVIPCYNEGWRINDTIDKIKKQLKEDSIKSYKIFVIDDASTDGTSKIVKEDKYCECIRYVNGPSRRENMSKAIHYHISNHFDVVAFMDADLSTDLEALNDLLISSSLVPIVIGNKYHELSNIERNRFRLFASRCMNWLTKFLFNTSIDDHFIGFKAFKSNVLKELCWDAGYNSHRSMFWDAEILIRAQWKGYAIMTIPVIWTEGKTSTLRIWKDLKILAYLIMFRLVSWIHKI